MSPGTEEFVLPRPGQSSRSPKPPIPGPPETTFTETFGTLLPAAKFLTTQHGKAAYYELLPASSVNTANTPDRVLFLHGVQTPALGMLLLTRSLQTSFPYTHMVLLDLWGHGLSDTPVLPHEPSLFFGLIDALLDHLTWPSTHLAGFSFGGALTAGYVALHPERVNSFTLIAPAGLFTLGDFSPQEQVHLRGGDEVAARKWVVEWLEGGELVVSADWKQRVSRGEVVAEAVREWQTQNHPGHTASVVAIVRDGQIMGMHDVFRRVAGSGIPNLAVLGGLDGVCKEGQIREVGMQNVKVVERVGHAVVRERAEEVARLIGEFWKTLR